MASEIRKKEMPYFYTIDDMSSSPQGMYAQGDNSAHPSTPSDTAGNTSKAKKKRFDYAEMEPTVLGCLANIIVFLCALLFCAMLTLLVGCRSPKETDVCASDSIRYEMVDTVAAAKVTDVAVGGHVSSVADTAVDYAQAMKRDDQKEVVYEEVTTVTCPDGSSSVTSKKYAEKAVANVRAEATAQATASTYMDIALMAHVLDSMIYERKTTEEGDRMKRYDQEEETMGALSFLERSGILWLFVVGAALLVVGMLLFIGGAWKGRGREDERTRGREDERTEEEARGSKRRQEERE